MKGVLVRVFADGVVRRVLAQPPETHATANGLHGEDIDIGHGRRTKLGSGLNSGRSSTSHHSI